MAFSDRLKGVKNVETSKISEEISFRDFIEEAVSKKIASIPVWYEYDYKQQFDLLMNFLDSRFNSEFEDLNLSDAERKSIVEEFLKSNKGFGVLDRLIEHEDVLALYTNSQGSVFVKYDSGFAKTDLVLTKSQFDAIENRFKANSSIVKSSLQDLSVTILKPPVAENILIIKKHKVITQNIMDVDALTQNLKNLLNHLLESRKNIVFASKTISCAEDFLQICLNSIEQAYRIGLLNDCSSFSSRENLSEFSTAQLDDFDFEFLLHSFFELDFDYKVCAISDYKKFLSYYQKLEPSDSGLVTLVRATNPNEAAAKFIQVATSGLKITEKQAKQRFSSIYDYLIEIEKDGECGFRISSILEITSTKTSSLVMNEIVKFVDDDYVFDLPRNFQELLQTSQIGGAADRALMSFRARLK